MISLGDVKNKSSTYYTVHSTQAKAVTSHVLPTTLCPECREEYRRAQRPESESNAQQCDRIAQSAAHALMACSSFLGCLLAGNGHPLEKLLARDEAYSVRDMREGCFANARHVEAVGGERESKVAIRVEEPIASDCDDVGVVSIRGTELSDCDVRRAVPERAKARDPWSIDPSARLYHELHHLSNLMVGRKDLICTIDDLIRTIDEVIGKLMKANEAKSRS